MNKGDTIKLANTTNTTTSTTKKNREYNEIKDSIIDKSKQIVLRSSEIRSELKAAIKILREKEGKEAIRERLLNDLYLSGNFVSKSLIYEVVNYEFATEDKKKEIDQKKEELNEKKREAHAAMVVGNDGRTQQVGSGNTDNGKDETLEEIRNRHNPSNLLHGKVKKASTAILKNNPSVNAIELENEEDDDDSGLRSTTTDSSYEDGLVNVALAERGNKVFIDDFILLNKIGAIIKDGKEVVLLVTRSLKVHDVVAGDPVKEDTTTTQA